MPETPTTIPHTVLVTGAFGQVGRRLTAILLDRGRTVVALDVRNDATEATAESLQSKAGGRGVLIPAFVNLLDADAVRDVVAEHRPEAIVHLASILAPTCYSNPSMAHRVNVDGTANLVAAATTLADPPFFVEASSSAVYGSRNPHRHADRLSAATPLNPVDCYGEDKVAAERLIAASGLPHATLRLGGIMSPDMLGGKRDKTADVLVRAVPRDNRIHMVDARDVALAFANCVDRADAAAGKVFLIAGDETCVLSQRQMEDDIMSAIGIGALGPTAGLPGDPNDDQGWFLTDWFDTSEAQQVLEFQQHTWQDILQDLRAATGPRRVLNRIIGPVVRRVLRRSAATQQKRDGRGPYADPWRLISDNFGPQALAQRR